MTTLLSTMHKSLSSRSLDRPRCDSYPTAELADYEKAVAYFAEYYDSKNNDQDDSENGGGFRSCMPNLSKFGEEEVYEPPRQVKRSVSDDMKRAVESLEYSPEDLQGLACNSAQFEILKQSLRKNGAVTNEVLKQKLPLFLRYKKDRMAARNPQAAAAAAAAAAASAASAGGGGILSRLPRRTRSASSASDALAQMSQVSLAERNSNLKPANRVLSPEELEADQPPQSMLGRIIRPNARRNSPMRSSSNTVLASARGNRTPPVRTRSTGRSIPNRTNSLSRFAGRSSIAVEGEDE
jgi:hypothetical protein